MKRFLALSTGASFNRRLQILQTYKCLPKSAFGHSALPKDYRENGNVSCHSRNAKKKKTKTKKSTSMIDDMDHS